MPADRADAKRRLAALIVEAGIVPKGTTGGVQLVLNMNQGGITDVKVTTTTTWK